jgi:hypothetical protein
VARNIFQVMFSMPDPEDKDSTSLREGETREEFKARLLKQAHENQARTDQAVENHKAYQEAKRLGIVNNALEWDDYLIASGKATDIQEVNGGFKVNGRFMSQGDYENWCHDHGRD